MKKISQVELISFLKKHSIIILVSIILLALTIFQRDTFFAAILVFVLFIKFLLSNSLGNKIKKTLLMGVWVLAFMFCGLVFYVNYNFPHGPAYSTGEFICENDDRGPCHEEYREDMSDLNMPDWAKFLREYWILFLIGLIITGVSLNKEGR